MEMQELMARYYDLHAELFWRIWGLQIHTGLFEAPSGLETAMDRMTRYLARNSDVCGRVLNVGCGTGGTDRLLVREQDATVVGLDLSRRQLAKARQLGPDITYVQGSMTDLQFPPTYFDFIWAQQSFFHCDEQQEALRQFFKVLKPGGRVVLEDTVLMDSCSRDEVNAAFRGRLPIKGFFLVDEYRQLWTEAGFAELRVEDLSTHLARTYAAIVDRIRTEAGVLKRLLPGAEDNIGNAFGFPVSQRLAEEGKLGAAYILLEKQ